MSLLKTVNNLLLMQLNIKIVLVLIVLILTKNFLPETQILKKDSFSKYFQLLLEHCLYDELRFPLFLCICTYHSLVLDTLWSPILMNGIFHLTEIRLLFIRRNMSYQKKTSHWMSYLFCELFSFSRSKSRRYRIRISLVRLQWCTYISWIFIDSTFPDLLKKKKIPNIKSQYSEFKNINLKKYLNLVLGLINPNLKKIDWFFI